MAEDAGGATAAGAGRGGGRTKARDRAVGLALLAAALLLLPGLGAIDLWAPDEPRYAEVAETLRRGSDGALDRLVLRLNGEVYTQKPPLYYWLAAAVGAPGGRVDEWAARLPSAIAGVLLVGLTATLGRRWLGAPLAGALAAGVLLTLPRFVHQARRAQLDVLLALFETLALAAYGRLLTAEDDGARAGTPWRVILHGAIGLAVLTKGPVGALPWAVIALHRLWEGGGPAWRRLFPLWGFALGLGPAVAWLAAVTALAPAGFFDDAFVDNVLARFFTGTDHVRPITYYLTRLPLDTLPWSPLAIVGGVMAWRARADASARGRAARLLLVWTAVFFVFFSLSAGKRGLYMLPLFPAVSLLAAWPLARWEETGAWPRGLAAAGAALPAAVAAAALWLAAGAPGWPRAAGHVPAAVLLSVAGLAAIGAGAIVFAARAERSTGAAVRAFVATVYGLEAIALVAVYPALDDAKSPRPIAEAVAAATTTHERVGVFRYGTLAGGLAYYSDRRVRTLETAEDVRAFRRDGGRIVVVRERDARALAEAGPAETVASWRSGRRRVHLARLSPDAAPGAVGSTGPRDAAGR